MEEKTQDVAVEATVDNGAEIEALKAQIAEAEAKVAEAKAAEAEAMKHLENTKAANARLAGSKEKAKEEVVETKSEIEKINSEILKLTEFAKEQKAAEAALLLKNKTEFIKNELKSKGFASPELLVGSMDVNSIEIKDGVIEGFEETVEGFKKTYPQLYVDSNATSSVSPSITFGKVETTPEKVMDSIYQKIKEKKVLSSTEQMWAVFGGTVKK